MLALCLLVSPVLFPSAHAASIAAPGILAGPDAGAATPNPSAIFWNPAAIGASEGVHFLFDGQAALVDVTATATRNDGIDPNTGVDYAPMHAAVTVPVAFVGATWKVIPKRLAIGLAIDDPFVGGGKYVDDSGDPDVHASGRYHGVNVELITVAVTPSVAVTIVPGFHVGGGFSYVIDHMSALQVADPLGTEGVAPEELGVSPAAHPYAYDVVLHADASGSHIAWNAGLFVDHWKFLQVGLSYASGGTFSATGDATVDVPAALSTTSEASTIAGKVAFTLYTAPIARLHVASQVNEKLWLGAGADYELWNVCCGTSDGDVLVRVTDKNGGAIDAEDGVTIAIAQDQYNPSRLWNAWALSAYGGYQANDRLWLGARVQYNQAAVPDYSVNPVNLDFENVGVMGGARYRLTKALTLGVSYSHFFLTPRTITDSAWNLQDGNERFSPKLPYKASANGTYSGFANNIGLRVAMDW